MLSGAAGEAPTMSAPLTAQGALLGTFEYMAPEQIEGGPVDARTDIFAFGCVLYEMLAGKKAFAGQTRASTLGAILKDHRRRSLPSSHWRRPRSIPSSAPVSRKTPSTVSNRPTICCCSFNGWLKPAAPASRLRGRGTVDPGNRWRG